MTAPENKMRYAVGSLLCSIAATVIGVGAALVCFIWFGIIAAMFMAATVVCMLVPILALAIYAFDGGPKARRIAIAAITIGILGPPGGCVGAFYAKSPPRPVTTAPP